MKVLLTHGLRSEFRRGGIVLLFLAILALPGCRAQQPELKQAKSDLQQHSKPSIDETAQARARQSQEISVLQEQDLPQLRGELERALHQVQELQGKQDDLMQRMSRFDQQLKKLEQLVAGTPLGRDIELRLETHDEVIVSIFAQIADLSKRIKAIEKK